MEIQKKSEQRASEILEGLGLDYNIEKRALKDDKGIETPYFGLYNPKSEQFLNCVTEQYHITQNKEILSAIIEGTQKFEKELNVKQVMDLHEGRKLMVTLEVMGDDKFGNDRISRDITIIDSNDGSTSLQVLMGFTVHSCTNGLFLRKAQDGNSAEIKRKHTRSIIEAVGLIPDKVEKMLSGSMDMLDKFKQFQQTKASFELAHGLSREIIGVSKEASEKELEQISGKKRNQMDAFYRNIETEMNAKGYNLWGLLNGVTRWTSHEKTAPNRENGRIESLALGTNAKVNEKAFNFVEKELVIS